MSLNSINSILCLQFVNMVGLSVGVGLSTAADTLFSQVYVYIVYDYNSLEEMYIHVVHIHTCTHNTICAWKCMCGSTKTPAAYLDYSIICAYAHMISPRCKHNTSELSSL